MLEFTLEIEEASRGPDWNRRMVSVVPITGTLTANTVTLECGHVCICFGNLELIGEKLLCTTCRAEG